MEEFEIFRCPVCNWEDFEAEEPKDYEHCPNCLSSIHEYDAEEEECGGTLEPVSIWVKPDGKWDIIQRCTFCGEMHTTPKANVDSPIKLLNIAAKPLAEPPFPIDRIRQLTDLMGGRGDIRGYYDEPRE